MKDFITYDIKSELSRDEIFENAIRILSNLEWRKGNSDSQGLYISGNNKQKITIQLWVSETPIEMFISFRSAWLGCDKEYENSQKQELINIVETSFIPSIGENINKTECA